ncbi:hypothetical protein T439DRAFT_321386 [Meredithblackwellia eburnea MCA 4105]
MAPLELPDFLKNWNYPLPPPSMPSFPHLDFDSNLRLQAATPATYPIFPWAKLSNQTSIGDLFRLPRDAVGPAQVAEALSKLARACQTGQASDAWGTYTCTLEVFSAPPSSSNSSQEVPISPPPTPSTPSSSSISIPISATSSAAEDIDRPTLACTALIWSTASTPFPSFTVILLHPTPPLMKHFHRTNARARITPAPAPELKRQASTVSNLGLVSSTAGSRLYARRSSEDSSPRNDSPLSMTTENLIEEAFEQEILQSAAFTKAKTLSEYLHEVGNDRRPEKDRLLKLFDHMAQICWIANRDGLVTYFSQQWYIYTGLPVESSMDHNVFHPDDQKLLVEVWAACIETGAPFDMQYRVRRADGIWRWCSASARVVFDDAGAFDYWVGTITEIDELVKVRSDALQLQAHISAVMTGANLVLLSVNLDGEVTFWEGSTGTALASPLMNDDDEPIADIEFVGKHVSQIWPDQKLAAGLKRVLMADGPDSLSVDVETLDRHNQRLCLRYRLSPLRVEKSSKVKGAIIVASNVTDLVEAEDALRTADADRAQLMASETAAKEASRLKTEFITTISHELRTPISGVIGICELLLDDSSLSGTHRSMITKALKSGEDLLDLIGMVLDLRKIEVGQISLESRRFTVDDIINEAFETFSTVAVKKNIKLRTDIGEHFPFEIMGDRLRVRQVVANGCSNALKFTPKGGEVTLRLRQEEESDSHIRVRIEVQDSGAGIAPEVLKTLFKPFQQADASTARHYGGSGLGLVISRRLAELLGGTVDLVSTVGKGSTMIITLPFPKVNFPPPSSPAPLSLSAPRRPSLKRAVTIPEASRSQRRRKRSDEVSLLVAEDNELLREIVMRTLTKMNFKVHGVGDGLAAVKAVHEQRYDLIIMDCQMPGMDGLDATARIRQSSDPLVAHIKVIALTANAIQGDMERCLAAGMNAYLSKPVRGADLEEAIWELLDPPHSPALY